jgi:hypothetical protein
MAGTWEPECLTEKSRISAIPAQTLVLKVDGCLNALWVVAGGTGGGSAAAASAAASASAANAAAAAAGATVSSCEGPACRQLIVPLFLLLRRQDLHAKG